MCFRPADVDQIEHRCPECGTNNLPEATMCARCFAPMEPLTEADILAQRGGDAPAGSAPAGAAPKPAPPSAPKPAAPKAPASPSKPPAVNFGDEGNGGFGDDGAVYF